MSDFPHPADQPTLGEIRGTGEARISSGQMIRLRDGVAEVVKASEPYYYRLTVQHRDISEANRLTKATAASYEALVEFLKQLEALDYAFLCLERVSSAASTGPQQP